MRKRSRCSTFHYFLAENSYSSPQFIISLDKKTYQTIRQETDRLILTLNEAECNV